MLTVSKVYSENFLTGMLSSEMRTRFSSRWPGLGISRWFHRGGQGGRGLWGKASGAGRLCVLGTQPKRKRSAHGYPGGRRVRAVELSAWPAEQGR